METAEKIGQRKTKEHDYKSGGGHGYRIGTQHTKMPSTVAADEKKMMVKDV